MKAKTFVISLMCIFALITSSAHNLSKEHLNGAWNIVNINKGYSFVDDSLCILFFQDECGLYSEISRFRYIVMEDTLCLFCENELDEWYLCQKYQVSLIGANSLWMKPCYIYDDVNNGANPFMLTKRYDEMTIFPDSSYLVQYNGFEQDTIYVDSIHYFERGIIDDFLREKILKDVIDYPYDILEVISHEKEDSLFLLLTNDLTFLYSSTLDSYIVSQIDNVFIVFSSMAPNPFVKKDGQMLEIPICYQYIQKCNELHIEKCDKYLSPSVFTAKYVIPLNK